MEFTLVDGIGPVKVSDVLICDLTIDSKTLFARVPDIVEKVSSKTKGLIARAIDTKSPVKITAAQGKELDSFFMDVGASLMKQGMKRMRTCGAAKFIPPRHEIKPEKE